MHELKALLNGGGIGLVRVDGEGALEIVDHWKQAHDQRAVGILDRLFLVRIESPARVLKIGLGARKALIQLIALRAQLGELIRITRYRLVCGAAVGQIFGFVVLVVDRNAGHST